MSGSSPRVRGTPVRASSRQHPVRFIPACAGNSSWLLSCGRRGFGSSPRVRGTRSSTPTWWCTATVHPRVCEELSRLYGRSPHAGGSSPRVRGTRRRPSRQCPGIRFIPACAGNSSAAPGSASRASVHPRVCGELPPSLLPSSRTSGSSPRVRGTRTRRSDRPSRRRFIPACAGNSWDNARQRGYWGGSSPRVRGTLLLPCGRTPHIRFIPACAGNSSSSYVRWRMSPVHPRVCGELAKNAEEAKRLAGSSPRVRGTRAFADAHVAGKRFIPACAGNSPTHQPCIAVSAVHPRVCGELLPPTSQSMHHAGSSPRVRGTRFRQRPRRPRARFIPACAGNSFPPAASASTRSVHPRVCGELAKDVVDGVAVVRFIPACAGNSQRKAPAPGGAPVHPRVCGELSVVAALHILYNGSSPRVRGTPGW